MEALRKQGAHMREDRHMGISVGYNQEREERLAAARRPDSQGQKTDRGTGSLSGVRREKGREGGRGQ